MFFKPGYVSTGNVLDLIIARSCANGSCINRLDADQRQKILWTEFYNFVQNVDCIYLLDRQGNIVQGDKFLAYPSDDADTYSWCLNPFFGILAPQNRGGLQKWRWYEWFPIIGQLLHLDRHKFNADLKKAWAEQLGMFVGMAVCFSEQQVDAYFSPDPEDQPADPSSEKEVTEAIVRMIDEGSFVTRAVAKERYGSRLSERGFVRAWASAASQRPELSKPGRRIAPQNHQSTRV